MFIWWKTGTVVTRFREDEIRPCPVCKVPRSYSLYLTYRLFSFMEFGRATDVGVRRLCDTCGHRWTGSPISLKPSEVRRAVPLMHRNGCGVLVAILLFCVAVVTVISVFR